MTFIDGVELIDIIRPVTALAVYLKIMIGIVAIYAVILLLGIASDYTNKAKKHIVRRIVLISIAIAIIVATCILAFTKTIDKTLCKFGITNDYDTYRVLISNEVDYKDFCNKYDIVGYNNDDDTYIIKLR